MTFDGIPIALLNGVGVVGIVVGIGWLFWRALNTGSLVTGREAQTYRDRARAAESLNVELVKQNSELMEMARLGQSVFTALRQAADQ